jgi:hypothetical protein
VVALNTWRKWRVGAEATQPAAPVAPDHSTAPKFRWPGPLQQGLAIDEMGFGVSLHANNPKPVMPALGQKRTSQRIFVMSALPPKADIAGLEFDVR